MDNRQLLAIFCGLQSIYSKTEVACVPFVHILLHTSRYEVLLAMIQNAPRTNKQEHLVQSG